MKKVHKKVYCSLCGDEIPAEELDSVSSPTCAICVHMQMEARQIVADRRELMTQNPQPSHRQPIAANSR